MKLGSKQKNPPPPIAAAGILGPDRVDLVLLFGIKEWTTARIVKNQLSIWQFAGSAGSTAAAYIINWQFIFQNPP